MERKSYDFNLHLAETDGSLRMFGDCRKLGVGQGSATLPAASFQELVNLSDKLAREPNREWGTGAGEAIFRGLFGEWPELNEVGKIFQAATDRVELEGNFLRLVIEYHLTTGATDTRGVHEVPWELLFHPGRGRFVVLDEAYLMVRYLRGTGETWHPMTGRRRILLTTACPAGQAPLKLESERRQIRSILERPALSGLVRCDDVEHVSSRRLMREFNRARNADEPFHIWHHCGHARTTEGAVRLVFHAQDGEQGSGPESPDPGLLLDIIKQQRDLRLIVMNVCMGGERLGLAALLASLKVPAAIGYRCQVTDKVALGFADAIWRRLPKQPVDLAIRGARRTLADTNFLDFAKIILFLRSLDDSCLHFF